MQQKTLIGCAIVALCASCGSDANGRGARDAGAAAQDARVAQDGGRDGDENGDGGPSSPMDAGKTPQQVDAAADAQAALDAAQEEEDAGMDPQFMATYVYQGGWDFGSSSYPFRTYSLDRDTGALTQVGDPVDLGPNPSFIAPSMDGRFLYVANESNSGGVTAASIGGNGVPTSLGLRQVVSSSSDQNYMVYTSLDPAGEHVLAASYNGDLVAVFPRQSSGALGPAVDSNGFQDGSQAHTIRVDPSGKWAFIPLKGTDLIAQFGYVGATGDLTPNTTAAFKNAAAGAGPRHIAIHPNATWAYVMNENNSTLSAYRISSQGLLEDIETVSTLPQDFSGTNTGAHVLVHPNGKYVYASNRGHDSIAVFAIEDDGGVSFVEHEASRGQTPRNFDIDSSGRLMVVANQDGGASLAVFRIAGDGSLSPIGTPITGLQQPNAVAIVNVPLP